MVGDNLETKYKNLKGRKITVVGWWDPTPSGTEDYKLILEVEKKFNCDLVERKLTDYAPLYSSILAGAPIADLFVPRDVPILNMANKNMLIALDTLPSMDVNDPLWNKAVTAGKHAGRPCLRRDPIGGPPQYARIQQNHV